MSKGYPAINAKVAAGEQPRCFGCGVRLSRENLPPDIPAQRCKNHPDCAKDPWGYVNSCRRGAQARRARRANVVVSETF